MNKFIKKWIKALRSGDYKQATGKLVKGTGSSRSYCCLGVAGSLLSAETGKKFKAFTSKDAECLNNVGLKATGLTDRTQSTLIGMNDGGKSFKQIANFLEKKFKEKS